MPTAPDPDRCRAATVRVWTLFRDLRRQREAWADGDPAGGIDSRNPDVAAFNAANSLWLGQSETDVLINEVARVIREELGGTDHAAAP